MTLTTLKYLGDGKFQHAGAHLRIIVYRRKSDVCELIPTKGVYLNLKRNISKAIKNSHFELDRGDIMVLYTDGLTEAENQDGEMVDADRFAEIVKKYAGHEPEAMKENIMNDIISWCNNIRKDDMSLVIVKRR
jgi:sigma-B regulation protein RsbU (phosphoserine phosphatase)